MGTSPAMVIKVAADIADAKAAFADVAGAATDSGETIQSQFTEISGSAIAMGAGIAVMAAEVAGALISMAIDGLQFVADQLWDVIDKAIGATAAFKDFKDELAESIETAGVLKAGLDSLGASLATAFGTDKPGLIRTLTGLINQGAIYVLQFASGLIEVGEVGVRVFGAMKVPLDAIVLAIITVGERFAALNAFLAETAAKLPGVGSAFSGLADTARAGAEQWAGYREEAGRVMQSHIDMAKGQGTVLEWTGKVKGAIADATMAMALQQAAAEQAATATQGLADANAGLVEGTGQAAVALYTQNEQLEKMDAWSRAIKNNHPFGVLLDGLTRTKPELEGFGSKAADAAAASFLLTDHLSKAAPKFRELGDAANDSAGAVKFAAEVIADASDAALSFSDAMDLVRQGKGTMGGTIGQASKPAGMSNMEFQQMQSDPRTWEIMHGYDWQSRGGTGSTWAWLDWQQPAGRGGNTTNITVNTVAGDKQAIASVVKDALADDWRRQGVKG